MMGSRSNKLGLDMGLKWDRSGGQLLSLNSLSVLHALVRYRCIKLETDFHN